MGAHRLLPAYSVFRFLKSGTVETLHHKCGLSEVEPFKERRHLLEVRVQAAACCAFDDNYIPGLCIMI
jgi:hypothetical protein